MIVEGTGINMDIIDYIKDLKSKGYRISTHFLKTELEICRQRIAERNQIKKHLHKVLDEDVIKYYNILWNQPRHMYKMIENISDTVQYIDNYSIDTSPSLSVI